jgi:hypothetical protein
MGKIPYDDPHTTTFCAAGCGSGKTQSMTRGIKEALTNDPNATFLSIAPGVALQKNIQSNYKQAGLVVGHYKQRFGPEFSNCVCQTTPESLLSVLKHDDKHPKHTHVHIDEASSIYSILFASSTMKGKRKETVSYLQDVILKECQHLTIACADMDDHIVDFYRKSRSVDCKMRIYLSPMRPSGWNNYIMSSEVHFWEKMLEYMLDGKCIFGTFDTKNNGNQKYARMIRYIFGKDAVIVIDRDSPAGQKDLNWVYEEMSKRQRVVAVLVSPTITCGVNMDRKVFHAVFSHASNASIGPFLKEQQDCRVRHCIGENHRFIYMPESSGKKARGYTDVVAKFEAQQRFGEKVSVDMGDERAWKYPFKNDLLYCHAMESWGKSNQRYREIRLAKQKARGDAIYAYGAANKGSKKRKRGLYNEVEHILNAPEISAGEYEVLKRGNGNRWENHDFKIKQYQIRRFLQYRKSELNAHIVSLFGKDPSRYIKQCLRLDRYANCWRQGIAVTAPRYKKETFETEHMREKTRWKLFHDFSALVGELFGLTKDYCDADQPTMLLKMMGKTSQFDFGPGQTDPIAVFPAGKLLSSTLKESNIVDKSAWEKKAKETVRLLYEDRELCIQPSRVKKKKDTTTTFLGHYMNICRELFPSHVFMGHQLVQVLQKQAYQKKKGGKTVRGYRYVWNQEAITEVRRMVSAFKESLYACNDHTCFDLLPGARTQR